MAKVFTFFNHKGGVGKTTLAYNIAWTLAGKGKRVLMIDADPQCNLTEITVSEDELDDSDFFLRNNIHEYLYGYVLPRPDTSLPEIEVFRKPGRERLQLLAGSIRLAELEGTISLAINNVPGLRNVPTSIHTALHRSGKDVDCMILDLSPALSATNQILLMFSDYFIVPVSPSIFSRQALMNLGEIFREWNRNLASFDIFNRKIKPLPQLLGIVCQNYRPYSRSGEANTKSARRFEERMKELNGFTIDLATDLNSFGMAVTPSDFQAYFTGSTPYRIADIPDYNQLAMISETEKIPVCGLDSVILNKYKINTTQYIEKLKDFKNECEHITDGLLKLF